MLDIETAPLEVLGRLCAIARRDSGLWNVDTAVAEDLLAVLNLAGGSRKYPGDLGFDPEIQAILQLWRSGPKA